MTSLLADAIGWFGAGCLLLAYAGLAAKRLRAGTSYHVLNLVGAGGLAFNGAYHHAWPSAALNVIWLAIGVFALRTGEGTRGRPSCSSRPERPRWAIATTTSRRTSTSPPVTPSPDHRARVTVGGTPAGRRSGWCGVAR